MIYEEYVATAYDKMKSLKTEDELIKELNFFKQDASNYPKKNIFDDLLIFSIQKNNLPLAKHCLDFGANPEIDNGILIKKSIKSLNYEKIRILTSQNNVDLSQYYNLQSDLMPTKKNETDYKNYPWRQAQKRQSEKSKIGLLENIKGRTLKEKNPLMLAAIEKSDLDTITKLKTEGVNLHADNDYYLQYAAKHNNTSIVEFFLKEGCDPSLHNAQSLIYAFSKSNFSLFKKLVVHGGLQDKNLESTFKKELKFHDEKLSSEINQEYKHIEFNNFLYDLQFNYLTSGKRNSKVEEKSIEIQAPELQVEEVEKKSAMSPFDLLMSQPINLYADNRKRKTHERKAEPKKEIVSPFDKKNVLSNIQETLNKFNKEDKESNIDINIQFKEEVKSIELVTEKAVGKELVNLDGKTITQKELQKSWDEGLILAFAKCESLNMRKFAAQVLESNKINFDMLKENNITLKRMPIREMKHQWDMTPHRFICQHMPQLSELLFKQKMADIPNNLNFYTQKIKELKINILSDGIDKKSSVKQEKRELRYTDELYEKTLLEKQINHNSIEGSTRNNTWNKVKR